MDVCEAEQQVLLPRKGGAIAEEIPRPPLVPSEKNNAFSRKTRPTREVPSRYKSTITSSPSLPTHIVPRRSSSPGVTRSVSSTPLFAKRSVSAERRRPSTPPSPPRPSTPNRDSLNDVQTPSRKGVGSVRTEGLWPSTMRSLCVSFQSDTFSLPISKKEKPVTHEHTLKPSANLGHRQSETPLSQRKTTPERKRTPLRGRNASDQSENSRPLDNSHSRIMDQRWPSRTGGKVSGSALNRSIDFTDKPSRTSSSPLPARGLSPSRKSPARIGLQKAQSEAASQLLLDDLGKETVCRPGSSNGASLRSSSPFKIGSSNVSIPLSSSERSSSTLRSSRSQSLPIPGSSRPASPSRAPLLSSSPSRGMISPSRGRPNTPFPSVGSVACRSSTSISVLSFIADVKKGKKGSNHIEDAHQLRLLYNRFMQWRFINARADAASSIQQIAAERTLYNVWIATCELWNSVTMKRINLRELTEELKLNSVLNDQMVYLDDWALLEREHSNSLAGAVEALEACTLRLPVTGGARVDSNSLKDAVCSALDVMQAMGSSVCSLQSRVEGMNGLVSALADVAAQERAMLDECVDLLASTVAMEVEENSLRTHLMQLKRSSAEGEHRTSLLGRLV
ncbi:hypothetical protein C5167_026088 [Papaver somniferum]|uniref:AUGMIN subunit 8-like n=1 Tax=Papaver somniferum TaxID=3469 RepID=UPI000E7025BB|nr:AUGMIN subunit 8-like [Papaver somniferum]XP_026443871.1 AUGMIN subunit 8-like [Papaver somniferum]RZC93332.1 hypothetical protein C5167_026088 [Papaver somniferum]